MMKFVSARGSFFLLLLNYIKRKSVAFFLLFNAQKKIESHARLRMLIFMKISKNCNVFRFFLLSITLKKSSKNSNKVKKLNLVAEYNSNDEQSADESDNKPLFVGAFTKNTKVILPVQIQKNIVDQPVEIENSSISEQATAVVAAPVKKIKNTFASIITGGRSPDSTENALHQPQPEDEPIENDNVEMSPAIELDTKAFKRKRRIEFITKPLFPSAANAKKFTATVNQVATEDSSLDDDGELCDISDDTKTSDKDIAGKSIKNNLLYANFKHSHTEFVTAISAASNTTDGNSNDDSSMAGVSADIDGNNCNSTDAGGNNKQRNDVHELRTIIESKLKFLCEGRPDVSAVQAIMIQMEVSEFKHYLFYMYL